MNKSMNAQAEPTKKSRAISNTFMRLLKLGKPYFGWYLILCILAAIVSLAAVGIAESLRRIINAATNKDLSSLISGAIIAIVIITVEASANFLKTYLSGVLEFKSTSKLQVSVLSRLLNVQMKDLDRYHSGDLISRINDSATAAQQGINQKTIDLFSNLMQITFLLTYLLSLQYALTLGMLLICSLVPLVMLPFSSRLRSMHEQRQHIETTQQMFIQDTVQGAEVVRTFSLAPKLQQQFTGRVMKYLKIHLPVSRLEAVAYNMPLAVILGGLLYVLSYGGYLVIHGRLDVGAVAAFLVCFEQIANPVSKLANLWTELQGSLAQGKRLFEVLDLQKEGVRRDSNGKDLHLGTSTNTNQAVSGLYPISFNNVGFGYGNDQVLTNVNLTIQPGKVTALAGPSGSGKSTLLQLILSSYEPNEGTIHSGNLLLNSIPHRSWRSNLAYVSQESYLFSGTLYENIAWGRPDATTEDIIAAAQSAGIHEFIMTTPHQYETFIGERGLTLSGGERQRLSIARAFVRKPKLLLLDEPTAALDSHNEEIIGQALQELMHDRTTVVVAHRLSTIRNADHIYYMEAGSIVEEGTHLELMDLKGKYYTMVETTLNNDDKTTAVMEEVQ
ncbi:ABC transporter ATP-binding protein [Paenibacillus agri]|uniref:ABC transporter ATP-binding protein n=1 Tax=Paenibacillus agri TaxID=2744309 RepID=A0A850EQY9_9BACL|nr:ABC transporter ATP-binding protein [Paenibacillus agri]NUU62190.1 ABC transporter ATP-binding protein [Paenibacillus agri]